MIFLIMCLMHSTLTRVAFDRDISHIVKDKQCPDSLVIKIDSHGEFSASVNKFYATPLRTGCHYGIASRITGFFSIFFSNGRVKGFFDNNGHFELFGKGSIVDFRRVNTTEARNISCGTRGLPSTVEPRTSGVRSQRLRRSGDTLFTEIIFVISQELVDKYRNTDGLTTNDKLISVYERFELVFNVMSRHYEEFGVQMVLLDIQLWTTNQFAITGSDHGTVLEKFQRWRANMQRAPTNDVDTERWMRHDAAQLFIPETIFSAGVIGQAYTSTMCGTYAAGVVAGDHSESEAAIATTSSHELGHNFGLAHDGACTCTAENSCIMGASMNSWNPPDKWSECSIDSFDRNIDKWKCLNDTPPKHLLYGAPKCGNHLVEEGEDCDCGNQEECPCCDPKTCKFLPDAECAAGACCSNCKIRSVGALCREASDDCDIAEYCDGQDETCPQNNFKQNGQRCAADVGMCLDGNCQRPDDQCKFLWGNGARSSSECMTKFNQLGKSYGFCKQSGFFGYEACSKRDSICGKQHCVGGEQDPIAKGYSFRRGQSISYGEDPFPDMECKVMMTLIKKSSFDSADPQMVQNGVPCAQDSFCILGECVKVRDHFPECPNNCSSHGTCNNHDACSCDCGWTGEDCSQIQWCHEYFLATIIGSGSIFAILLLSIIVLYILRTTLCGIPVFPLCPVKPKNNGTAQFTAGEAVIIQSSRTESDGFQFPSKSKLELITRQEILNMNRECDFPAPPNEILSPSGKPSRPAPPAPPTSSKRPSRAPPARPSVPFAKSKAKLPPPPPPKR